MPEKELCADEGCRRLARTDGLCARHHWDRSQGLLNPDGTEVRPARDGLDQGRHDADAKSQCMIEGCGRVHSAKGLCSMHYVRKRRGDPDWDDPSRRKMGRKPLGATCLVEGCRRAALAKGLCARHYQRKTAGKPDWDSLLDECRNGHRRTKANTAIRADGTRKCRVCARAAQARSRPNQKLEITPEMHGTATGYRYGCRCDACRTYHSQESQERRWMVTFGPGGPMGPQVRGRILLSLERTGNVKATADEVGVTHQAIYGACAAVPGFGTLVRDLIK